MRKENRSMRVGRFMQNSFRQVLSLVLLAGVLGRAFSVPAQTRRPARMTNTPATKPTPAGNPNQPRRLLRFRFGAPREGPRANQERDPADDDYGPDGSRKGAPFRAISPPGPRAATVLTPNLRTASFNAGTVRGSEGGAAAGDADFEGLTLAKQNRLTRRRLARRRGGG